MIYIADSALFSGVVPPGATAITFNLTVTDTTGLGFAAVAPGDAASTDTSTINWTAAGMVVANATMVQLDTARQVKVFVGGTPGASTHFIIDVTGYVA